MTRTLKTPQTKAKEALDLANRKVARAETRLAKMVAAASEVKDELDALKAERDYAAQNPALTRKPADVDGTKEAPAKAPA